MILQSNSTSAMQLLEGAAPIASAVASIGLVILYYFQFGTLEEQRKLSKANQCPVLTGPHDFVYDAEENLFGMSLTNAGDGPAMDIVIKAELLIEEQEEDIIEGGTNTLRFSRADREDSHSDDIQPREADVQFETNAGHLPLTVTDRSENSLEGEQHHGLEEMISFLRDKGVERAQIRFQITYKDQFGESENPFDREYAIQTIPMFFGVDTVDKEEILLYFGG